MPGNICHKLINGGRHMEFHLTRLDVIVNNVAFDLAPYFFPFHLGVSKDRSFTLLSGFNMLLGGWGFL